MQNKDIIVNDFRHLKMESACWSKSAAVTGGKEGVWMYRGFGQTTFVAADSEEYKIEMRIRHSRLYKKLYGED
jgi:hypothetical protein